MPDETSGDATSGDATSGDATFGDAPASPASSPASSPAPAVRAQPNDPMHGVTLEAVLNSLVAEYGWEELGDRIRINCFVSDPSVKSSLKFLRKTPWARTKVEKLYLSMVADRHGTDR